MMAVGLHRKPAIMWHWLNKHKLTAAETEPNPQSIVHKFVVYFIKMSVMYRVKHKIGLSGGTATVSLEESNRCLGEVTCEKFVQGCFNALRREMEFVP